MENKKYSEEEIKNLIKAQQEYARKNEAIMFASTSGRCWSCNENIVDEKWATQLITGCKFCNRSFCD